MNIKTPKADSRRDLYLLAQSKKTPFAVNKDWVEPLLPSMLGAELLQLACNVNGVDSMTDDDILPAMFEDSAVALLTTLPNRYWFWRIVEEAVTTAGNGRGKIGADVVLQVFAAERNQVATAYDLTASLADLDIHQVAERVALGICVVRSKLLPEPGVVANPVFVNPSAQLHK